METTNVKTADLNKLIRDVEMIKRVLIDERELTDWAKDELEKARNTPESEYVSLEEVRKKISAKK